MKPWTSRIVWVRSLASNTAHDMAVTREQTVRFYHAIRARRLDVGDAARCAGLRFHESAEIFSIGMARKHLFIADDFPGFRYIQEVGRDAPEA